MACGGRGRRRALRITADLLVTDAIVGLLWLFFPMTARVDMAPGAPATVNDIGHLVMTAVTIVLILSQIGFSAAVFGWRFRIYAIASVVTVVVFGRLTAAQASKLPTGGTTPYMGFVERISIAPWLWMAVLAVVLITARSAPVSRRVVAPPGRADFPG